MSKIVTIKAAARSQAGKGAARSIRREGNVPGVVYGDGQAPQMITLTYKNVLPHVETGRFLSTLVDLDLAEVARARARVPALSHDREITGP